MFREDPNDNETCFESSEVDEEHQLEPTSTKTAGGPGSKKRLYSKGIGLEYHVVTEEPSAAVVIAQLASESVSVDVDLVLKQEQVLQSSSVKSVDILIEQLPDGVKKITCSMKPGKSGNFVNGKTWSPKGFSLAKRQNDDKEIKKNLSRVSGYGKERSDGKVARPQQLLTPQMMQNLLDPEMIDVGGYNTITGNLEQALSVIEQIFEAARKPVPKEVSGETVFLSAEDAFMLINSVLKAHFHEIPSIKFVSMDMYKNIYKLVKSGPKTSSKKRKNFLESAACDKKKFVPKELTAKEKDLYKTCLSELQGLIMRCSSLMGGIDFLKVLPKFKENQYHTYFNQDLEYQPGDIVWYIQSPQELSSKEEVDQGTSEESAPHQDFAMQEDDRSVDHHSQLSWLDKPSSESDIMEFLNPELWNRSPKKEDETSLSYDLDGLPK